MGAESGFERTVRNIRLFKLSSGVDYKEEGDMHQA